MARKFTFTTQVYDEKTDFPTTGDVDVIYIDASKNTAYRYDDSYYKISSAEVNVWGALGSVSKGGGGGGSTAWGSITGTLSSQTDLQTALDAKQNTLVSGTSIKTINSTSLLGSGDVAVQPALVSGTNIKTINGSSVLGSGNLSISGGLQGVHNVNGYFPSTAYGIDASITAGIVTNQATIANTLYLYPFIPNKTITSVSLKIQVTVLGAGVNCRILIYSDLNGFPNTKLYESANLDCSSIGIKTAVTSFTFNQGTTYWLALHSSGVTTLSHINTSSATPLFITNVGSQSVTQYSSTIAFGSAPTIYTYSSQFTGALPRIVINLS